MTLPSSIFVLVRPVHEGGFGGEDWVAPASASWHHAAVSALIYAVLLSFCAAGCAPEPKATDGTDIIRNAIAKQVGKKVETLTDADLAKITDLDLSETSVGDLSPLAQLAELRVLDLSFTRVTNLTGLSQVLRNLTSCLTRT
jgi:Leucine-rich repeat (LRR) protein